MERIYCVIFSVLMIVLKYVDCKSILQYNLLFYDDIFKLLRHHSRFFCHVHYFKNECKSWCTCYDCGWSSSFVGICAGKIQKVLRTKTDASSLPVELHAISTLLLHGPLQHSPLSLSVTQNGNKKVGRFTHLENGLLAMNLVHKDGRCPHLLHSTTSVSKNSRQ